MHHRPAESAPAAFPRHRLRKQVAWIGYFGGWPAGPFVPLDARRPGEVAEEMDDGHVVGWQGACGRASPAPPRPAHSRSAFPLHR